MIKVKCAGSHMHTRNRHVVIEDMEHSGFNECEVEELGDLFIRVLPRMCVIRASEATFLLRDFDSMYKTSLGNLTLTISAICLNDVWLWKANFSDQKRNAYFLGSLVDDDERF